MRVVVRALDEPELLALRLVGAPLQLAVGLADDLVPVVLALVAVLQLMQNLIQYYISCLNTLKIYLQIFLHY